MFFVYLLGISCILLLGWGVRTPERIYQYPFLSATIFLSFIIPQAISLVRHPFLLKSTSVDQILFVSCLCLWMTWIGYRIRPNLSFIQRLNITVDDKKLFRAGIALVLVSFLSSLVLQRITISTNDVGNWTGPATILYFFGNLRYIAVAIFLTDFLKRRSLVKFLWLAFGILPILETVLVYGRRTPTFTLVILVGVSLFFVRRIAPPRILVIAIIALGAFLIPLIGEMRGNFWIALFTGELGFNTILAGLDRILLKGDVLELRNGAMLLEAANNLQKFGLGTGFWSDIVFQYVPGQLVGYDIKQALQINLGVSQADILNVFGTTFPAGSTKTGIGDSYAEFGYFGCLVFGAIAYLYRHIWISAFYYRNNISQILYIGLLSPALVGVTHGIGRFLQDAIFQIIFVGLAVQYAKQKPAVSNEYQPVHTTHP